MSLSGSLPLSAVIYLTIVILWSPVSSSSSSPSSLSAEQNVPCEDVFRGSSHKLPCLCTRDTGLGSSVNCDHVSFFGQFPALPFRQRILAYSQRHSAIQNLEPQLFTASNIPLERVDFSFNLLRRLMERIFDGIESTLIELNLSHNLLGDQLNPIFSTNEFLHLKSLEQLDLSHNELRALDNNIFRGLRNLTNLNLQGNSLTISPGGALSSPRSLKVLNLGSNLIEELHSNSFPTIMDTLTVLNLTDNRINFIGDNCLSGLTGLKELHLARNDLRQLSVDSLSGLRNLESLDLSNNFLDYVPSDALSGLKSLKTLNLGTNNILTIEENAFVELVSLEVLDLSRNSLANLNGPNVFAGLLSLKNLNLAYNGLKKLDTMDEATFLPLHQLEVLDLTDNHLMNFPTQALNGLPGLRKVFLDYNQIGLLSEDALSTILNVDELSLAYNLVHDLPDGLFNKLTSLQLLNLHGNKVDFITQAKFDLIADNLLGLDIGFNDLADVPKFDLPKLMILNIAMNQFSEIKADEEPFEYLPSLRHLNMSFNQLSALPAGLFKSNKLLEVVDIEGNTVDKVERGVFASVNCTSVNLSGNKIKEIGSNSFENLVRLKTLDLSNNEISSIKNGAFDGLSSLRKLDMSRNKLTSFKGDFFTTRTRIEELNLSENLISYLYPNSFIIHRRLRTINVSANKLSYFPSEIVNTIRSLIEVNLSFNKLQSIDSNDFANMPRLRTLQLRGNEISFFAGTAIKNSTALRTVDLAHNLLTALDEHTFRGISSLRLDLAGNQLTELPADIFNRRTVFQVEQINLSSNQFSAFPSDALRNQYSCLETVDISHNKITSLPVDSNVLVNVKELDVSFNPLSSDARTVLFSEPKSTRKLNVAGIGMNILPTTIELPFLKSLNLSSNSISVLKANSFERTSLLQLLDISKNQLSTINNSGAWKKLTSLRKLYLSENPITYITKADLEHLVGLEVLDLSKLTSLNHLECDVFSKLRQLRTLLIFGYPSLSFLESQECLQYINSKLEQLAIEMKETFLQGHLHRAFSGRIRDLTISGSRMSAISPSALNGVRGPQFNLKLMNTSIANIPAHIFAPLPLSTRISLDLEQNEIRSLDGQLVNALDSKQMSVRISGLQVNCDCKSEPLWRWLNERMKLNANVKYYNSVDSNLTCWSPRKLAGWRLIDLDVEQLACDEHGRQVNKLSTTSTTRPPVSSKGPSRGSWAEFDVNANDIATRRSSQPITGITRANKGGPPGKSSSPVAPKVAEKKTNLTKVDTMIIGVVAGVIAFVCILILIICVVKLKSGSPYEGHAHNHRPGGTCTCMGKLPHTHSPAAYASGTVASRAGNGILRPAMPPSSFYANQGQPVPPPPPPPVGTLRGVPTMKMVPTYGHTMGRSMAAALKNNQAGYYMYSEDDRFT